VYVVKSIPVVLNVVLENENEVATEVVVKATEVVVGAVVVVVVPVVTVVVSVTPRKFEAKSSPSPAGQTLSVGATEQALTEIR
jgi:hypothetical protein